MIKKICFVILIIINFLFISGCRKTFYSEYKNAYLLEEENVYIEISLDDLYKKMDTKENFLVYYGQSSCNVCYASVGFFDTNAKAVGISTIYYLKAKILNFGGDDKRVDEMQATIGFDEANGPQAAPRLWCFIDGVYTTGMASFTEPEDSSWDLPSQKLFSYFIESTKTE